MMERKLDLLGVNITPDKTEVAQSSNSISVKNKGCKGVVKKREECKTCKRVGLYQAGILALLPCCNRDNGWRKFSGKTDAKCKHYLNEELEAK